MILSRAYVGVGSLGHWGAAGSAKDVPTDASMPRCTTAESWLVMTKKDGRLGVDACGRPWQVVIPMAEIQ